MWHGLNLWQRTFAKHVDILTLFLTASKNMLKTLMLTPQEQGDLLSPAPGKERNSMRDNRGRTLEDMPRF